MTKVCRECNKELPIDDFYIHKSMGDGHLNKCKNCVRNRVSKHREENIESIREYDRNRLNTDKRQASKTKITRTRRHQIPGYQACHNAITRAIKNGTMVRSNTCQICSKQGKTEAHHNNYLEKLNVLWLCPCCHKAYHNGKSKRADRIRLIVDMLLSIQDKEVGS
jgi:hypothetical protein